MGTSQKVVPLDLIIDSIEMASDYSRDYLDTEEMEIVSLPTDGSYLFDPEAQQLAEDLDADIEGRYKPLPSTWDIDEYDIMREFVYSLTSAKKQEKLSRALQGRGAFHRFKDAVWDLGLRDQWFAFQHEAYEEIARSWCREQGLACDRPEEEEED